MSRIGKMPIPVPAGVDVRIDGSTVTVKGPKGSLSREFKPSMKIALADGALSVTPETQSKRDRSLHGLSRTLLGNMVTGVTVGFKKELEINGVGYRCQKTGKELNLVLGFSHPVIVRDTDDITIEAPSPNKIIINGVDKQKVGQFAAEVRGLRPPEPYKGKGIKYADETIIRKEGKAGKGKK
ncbi:MAG: 50S ribosomal protein L6 [Oscillospiraceae bacterium]|jgi:large subunit ribosomal protein L6|nr:50S ribosomal protein L6 [Oscillospiraceae bacterium]